MLIDIDEDKCFKVIEDLISFVIINNLRKSKVH